MVTTDMWTYRETTWSGMDLSGFEVEATDGGIGKVDETTNEVGGSYIVVDTGPWIFGKKVMLPARVVRDIVRSTLAGGRIVLPPVNRRRTTPFMQVPLDLKSPHALATLACIVTATPGTLWVGHDAARGVMTLHVLDLVDEAAWVRKIKGDYETLLLEIFE